MDLKTLKLELLERIADLDDEVRLLALKRLLDGPPTYAVPGDHLTVVREGEAPYLKLEDRMYTAAEVRALVEKVLRGGSPTGRTTHPISRLKSGMRWTVSASRPIGERAPSTRSRR